MHNNIKKTFLLPYVLFSTLVWGQLYEDRRCVCVCPSPTATIDRRPYVGSVPPNKCDCDNVILPRVGAAVKGREQDFCVRCDCRYESRNTAVIKVVVIIVLWVLTLLLIYMGFLICLKPLISKRRPRWAAYQQVHSQEAQDLLCNDD